MFDHFYMTGVGMAGYVIVYVPLTLSVVVSGVDLVHDEVVLCPINKSHFLSI